MGSETGIVTPSSTKQAEPVTPPVNIQLEIEFAQTPLSSSQKGCNLEQKLEEALTTRA